MAQAAIPAPLTGRASATTTHDRAGWRWAGGLGLAHIVTMLGAFALEGVAQVEHGDTAAKLLHVYRGVSVSRLELASYVEAMAFVPLLAALVILGRRLGGRTETGGIAAQTALGLGVAYVGSTFAVGFPPLTAAVYGAHHGVGAGALSTVNDLRNYGFLLQVALMMTFTLALGIAALAERRMTRWGGYGGVVLGAIGVLATPFAHNAVSMVWIVWWIGFCVLCLKGGGATADA